MHGHLNIKLSDNIGRGGSTLDIRKSDTCILRPASRRFFTLYVFTPQFLKYFYFFYSSLFKSAEDEIILR
jgi:hypothetical protein